MEIFALAGCILVGYIIGMMQGGIHVYKDVPSKKTDEPKYNKSVGLDEFKEYYDETGGINKF